MVPSSPILGSVFSISAPSALTSVLSTWLTLRDIGRLDVAVAERALRLAFLRALKHWTFANYMNNADLIGELQLEWLLKR